MIVRDLIALLQKQTPGADVKVQVYWGDCTGHDDDRFEEVEGIDDSQTEEDVIVLKY